MSTSTSSNASTGTSTAVGLDELSEEDLKLAAETQALERSVRAARAGLSAARPRPQTARWGVT